MGNDRDHPVNEDAGTATRAAWLYYEASLTQAEIGRELGLPPAKVQRLIARATREGLVRILIEGDLAGCLSVERDLVRDYNLRFCRVVPDLPAPASLFSVLGRAAAAYLHQKFSSGSHGIIGVGHGRTLAATADHLPRDALPDLTIVSVLGDVPRRIGANPFDVVHTLAEKTGAQAYLLPVPFYANTPEDRTVLMRQRGVPEAFRVAKGADLFVLGIGEVSETGFICQSGMILPEEIVLARRDGAAAEVLGSFYDHEGRMIKTALHDRVVALPPDAMKGRDVVAVAGGLEKATAIRAMLKSGLLTALITDERTAHAIIGATLPRARPQINIVGR